MRFTAVRLGIAAVAILATGCDRSNDAPSERTGGRDGAGGVTASGGTRTATTASVTGGATGAGGMAATGGTPATGGTTASGGAPGSGGAAPAGGAGGTGAGGGGFATGGTTARGGATGSGGLSTGGSAATGGATSSGGSLAGGSPVTGGSRTGGQPGSGGATPTGGTTASGGQTGTGGSTAKPCGTTAASLRAAADCTGRLIGAALSTQHLGESAYATAAKELNYVTAENEMKWSSNEPARGQFSFAAGDEIVTFARNNGMKVKGHALVWHNQLPGWASALTGETDVRAAMLAHIKGVVEHYKGKVQAWDVVNEAVSLDGTGMRDSPFYRYLGETFIDEAFKAARAADPDAKLYYNDYNCEGLTPKANKVFDLVKRMKERNVPFDGVGLQLHYGEPNQAVPTADFAANLQRYIDLDLDVLISEMDVHVCAGLSPTDQQAIYHDLVAVCVAQPRCVAITFWGINDKYSWLNDEDDLGCAAGKKPLGLLWDDNFKKKPAYTGVLEALLGL